jgi:hypothetical protein
MGEITAMVRAELSGELTVPWSFKPSSLIGDVATVRYRDGGKRLFTITRAYTLRKYPWGRKRVRYVAEGES